MLKKMRGKPSPTFCATVLTTLILFGCGYSQDEWDQKVRETEELRNNLAGEKSAREKAEADYADALEEIDALRQRLTERGLSVDTLSANLESQKKALAEYQRRMDRLDQIRKRFEQLRDKLQQLTALGLKVDVRDNRMVIQLPGDVLFDSGSDKLKKGGQDILLEVASVIQSDEDLSNREFQVAGHTDDRPLRGGRFGDNWGLSAMRARSVLLLLTTPEEEEGGGLPIENWSAAGYGSTDPVASNESPEGRTRNRRVALVVQPDVAEMLNLNSIAESQEGKSP
jgi:chemotaxis protein MotB